MKQKDKNKDNKVTLKKFPIFLSDQEAEDFVDNADLTEYDWSDMKPMKFEIRRKDKSISIRLPESLLTTIQAKALKEGIPYQRLIRQAIEDSLR
jgi:predicted DNA binding CopG/RHH family protein